MRLRPALALALLCWGACRAQTVVPLELEDGNDLATLRIGESHLKAVLDTSGAYGIAITPEALAKLRVRFSGNTVERTGMGGDKFRGRDFVIPAVELGDTIFLNVDGLERRRGGGDTHGPPPYDAVIGGEFLENYTVIIDYPRQRLELHRPGSGAAVCGPPLAAMMPARNGMTFTTVRTDAGVMNLGWSSGSTYSVVLKTVTYLRGLAPKDGFYTTKRFAFGRFNAGPVDLVVLELPGVPDLDGLIGDDFFERYRVCFDYEAHTVNVQTTEMSAKRKRPRG